MGVPQSSSISGWDFPLKTIQLLGYPHLRKPPYVDLPMKNMMIFHLSGPKRSLSATPPARLLADLGNEPSPLGPGRGSVDRTFALGFTL